MALTDQHAAFRNEVLKRLGPALAHGAEERMSTWAWWTAPPAKFVGHLLSFLDAHPRFYRPGYAPPEDQLERVLAILPLEDSAREQLRQERHLDWGSMGLETLATVAVDHIRRPGNEHLLATASERPARELRLLDVFRETFNAEVPLERRDALARSWGREFGHLPEHEAVRAIARRLAIPSAAAAHGCATIDDPKDSRLRALPAARSEPDATHDEPARGQDGRFAPAAATDPAGLYHRNPL